MSRGCCNLCNWESNNASKYTLKHFGNTSQLGILQNLDNDTLRYNINVNKMTCDIKIIKRLILFIVQTILNPVGILAPKSVKVNFTRDFETKNSLG